MKKKKGKERKNSEKNNESDKARALELTACTY